MATTSQAQRGVPRQRGVSVSLRAPVPVWELIDQAARLVGKSRSEFMLESAQRYAKDVLLNQRSLLPDELRHAALLDILSAPAKPTAELKKLLARRSPW